ncbi:MAG: hypothetical protein P4M11_07750 [Candidatus Pacebacteria bacterium]|nr:hypothetical protein [Candidatus Paceibacterota bacterium]
MWNSLAIYIYGFKCSDDVTRCWSPEHYANMVISTVFIVYFLWICFIYSVPVCEYFPVSRNALAKFASLFIFPHRIVVTYDFVDYMFKLAMCVNFAFLDVPSFLLRE